jgi:hypothetical protein
MKYTIQATATVSCWTEVEAESEEDALKIAEERELAGLCYNPFSAGPDECWHIDTDGTPKNLYVG